MAKRRIESDSEAQLDLFAQSNSAYATTHTIRPDGRETLAPVPAEDGRGTGIQGDSARDAPRGGGENGPGNGLDPSQTDPARADAPTSPRPGLGNGEGAIYLAPGRRRTQRYTESVALRNQDNYRITAEDRLGSGSLKQKCRDNLAAIRLLRQLESESRPATRDEKRVLVRYVGWGGLPQVFDVNAREFRKEQIELSELLTEEEHHSARATTLNAHYTSPVVIQAMYAALRRFGFEHGRILEPALGLGHFIGVMPEEMHSHSIITGVEIDSITARLAKALYPDADVRHQPFEEARLADGFYDVAISNVPFGDYQPFDERFNAWRFPIHDYYFASAVEKLRTNGLLLFITSKGTLDKSDGALRQYLSQRTEFLGAIRLPNDAFKANANTEVTPDTVMLRKLRVGERSAGPTWRAAVEFKNTDGEVIHLNEYFAEPAQMVPGAL